jgi:peptide/nickel transport system ATP-binding protein
MPQCEEERIDMLRLTNVSARYNLLDSYVHAVDKVSFSVKDDEIFGIAGESGCGKSTLLKVMYDLIRYPLEISQGKVEIVSTDEAGKETVVSTGEIRNRWWKNISYVPQGAMHVMNPVRRVKKQFFDTINKYHRVDDKKQLYREVVEYFKTLELSPEVLEAYPHQLSGGMRQRALIALATFLKPDIILADEPTTALDVIVQRSILTMFKRIQRKNGNSMILVSHDMGVHYQITNRMGIMYAGQMIEIGETDEIFNNPRHPYTQMLIGALPRVGDNSQREGIPGSPPGLKNPPKGCRFAERCRYTKPECRNLQPLMSEVSANHYVACLLLNSGTAEPAVSGVKDKQD